MTVAANTYEEEVRAIANTLLAGKTHIKVLEAGCGSASHVRFTAAVNVVGIDISREELDQNADVQDKILGDIQDYPLPKEEFDVAVCWTVLEHLSRPRDALRNLFGSVKPGGLVILAFPNLLSYKGIVTKITPYWFHRLFYRFMRYKKRPFPTYLRVAILPKRLIQLAKESDFSVPFCIFLEGGVSMRVRSRFRFMDIAFSVADSIIQATSLGRLQSFSLDNCVLILKKNGQHI